MRIFMHSYLFGNFGDDLLMLLMLQHYPQAEFVCLATDAQINYYRPLKDFQRIHWIKKNTPVRIGSGMARLLFRKDFILSAYVKKCDATIAIGGSVFAEHKKWQMYFSYLRSMEKSSPRFFVLDANFGPYSSPMYYKAFRKLFRDADGVCFRDSYSYNLFKDLPAVRLASDIVFSMNIDGVRAETLADKPPRVFVSVISLANRSGLAEYQSVYVEQIVNVVTEMIGKGYEVDIVGFCRTEGDAEGCDLIYDKLSIEMRKHTHVIVYDGNISTILRLIEESKCVIGTRFHAVVIGWLYGKNTIPIIYNEKTRHMINDLAYEGLSYDLMSGQIEMSTADIIKNAPLSAEALARARETTRLCYTSLFI